MLCALLRFETRCCFSGRGETGLSCRALADVQLPAPPCPAPPPPPPPAPGLFKGAYQVGQDSCMYAESFALRVVNESVTDPGTRDTVLLALNYYVSLAGWGGAGRGGEGRGGDGMRGSESLGGCARKAHMAGRGRAPACCQPACCAAHSA